MCVPFFAWIRLLYSKGMPVDYRGLMFNMFGGGWSWVGELMTLLWMCFEDVATCLQRSIARKNTPATSTG